MVKQPVKVFFSYAHRDEDLLEKLVRHLALLKREITITAWHDREIVAGNQWAEEIRDHLQSADLILLLVSADFIASDYCYAIELKQAMKRHYNREATVIPIILRSVDWQNAPFGQLQALPKDAKPITSWTNEDEAFLSVVQGIRRAVEEIIRRKHQPLPREQSQYEQVHDSRPREQSASRHRTTVNPTAICIGMILLGWFVAGLISGHKETGFSAVSRQIAIAGGLGGLTNGIAISMRLQLFYRTASNVVGSVAIWTICNAIWGFVVGYLVESGLSQGEGVLYVVIPGIAIGILFLIWQLKQLRYR